MCSPTLPDPRPPPTPARRSAAHAPARGALRPLASERSWCLQVAAQCEAWMRRVVERSASRRGKGRRCARVPSSGSHRGQAGEAGGGVGRGQAERARAAQTRWRSSGPATRAWTRRRATTRSSSTFRRWTRARSGAWTTSSAACPAARRRRPARPAPAPAPAAAATGSPSWPSRTPSRSRRGARRPGPLPGVEP